MFGFPSLVYPHIGEISRFFPLEVLKQCFLLNFYLEKTLPKIEIHNRDVEY